MPGSDGMGLLRHLRSEGIEVPVVFLTGHGDVPTAVKAMREGAFDLLTKPVEKEPLMLAIKNALFHSLENEKATARSGETRERFNTLTPSEKSVYRMVVEGLPNKAIAAEMGNAERTVKLYRSSLSRKMGAQCVADLVRYFIEASLE